MHKFFLILFLASSFVGYSQRNYSLMICGHSNWKNLDNKFPIQSNNVKSLDGFIAALLVKDPTNKKPRFKIEAVSSSNTSLYSNIVGPNTKTKLVDKHLAFNFAMACVSYTFNEYNFSFNLGLGINMLASRNFYNEQNVNINNNTLLPAPIGFGKHLTLNNTAEIENSINISKSIQLSVGVRYTGGLINRFTDTDNFTVKAPPGNNISVTAGIAIKLFGPSASYEDSDY